MEYARPNTLSPLVVEEDIVVGREYVASGTVRNPVSMRLSVRSLFRGWINLSQSSVIARDRCVHLESEEDRVVDEDPAITDNILDTQLARWERFAYCSASNSAGFSNEPNGCFSNSKVRTGGPASVSHTTVLRLRGGGSGFRSLANSSLVGEPTHAPSPTGIKPFAFWRRGNFHHRRNHCRYWCCRCRIRTSSTRHIAKMMIRIETTMAASSAFMAA